MDVHVPSVRHLIGIQMSAGGVLGGIGDRLPAKPLKGPDPMRSFAVAVLVTAFVAACGSSGAGQGQPVATNAVTIADDSFSPTAIKVGKGTSVTWTTTGSDGHTVTADDSSFDSSNGSGATLAAGSTFSHTFAAAGTFAYHCKVHSSMHGTVTVTG
jgi:plastocyanin